MLTIHLPECWSRRLVQMPESGMGYQRVDLIFKDRRIENVIVLNAEDCQTDESFDPAELVDIQMHRE